MNDSVPKQTDQLIFERLAEQFPGVAAEWSGLVWLLVVAVVLIVGLFYVGWMYRRDSASVGWGWASLLGLLRGLVYLLLAAVFLLPAIQKWQETTSHSRVVVLHDVSQSLTDTRDIQTEGVPPEKQPTRQELVLQTLEKDDGAFMNNLVANNPVFLYRWGSYLDENFHVFTPDGHYTRQAWEARGKVVGADEANAVERGPSEFTAAHLRAFLKPNPRIAKVDEPDEEKRKKIIAQLSAEERLVSGTNMFDSVLSAVKRESGNKVQGYVVFSDGHSNEGTAQALKELKARVTDKSNPVPIFVVAVGEDRPTIRVEVTDVRGPDQARPENDIPIKVEVTGVGLGGQPVDVSLYAYGPTKDPKKPEDLEKPDKVLKPKAAVKFNTSSPPHATAEFEVKPALFAPEGATGKPEFAEGEWKFVPRVPRVKGETSVEPFHTAEPTVVRIQKRPLRVLLFASAATHDYQFLRTFMARELQKERVDLAIHLQPPPGEKEPRKNIVQDVDPKRLLLNFPSKLIARDDAKKLDDKKPDDENKDKDSAKALEDLDNLAAYDVIIAFDPDWSRLTAEQIRNVDTWVRNQGGGLVVVAGPINTLELARPRKEGEMMKAQLQPILNLYPVELDDPRAPKKGAAGERKTDTPWRLNFRDVSPAMEFLRLDEESENRPQLAGWSDFYGDGPDGSKPGSTPKRGFYNFYPVKKAKPGTQTIATFSDPQAKLDDGSEMPYMVTTSTSAGTGRVVWIGWGEMWRLREYSETYLERFWTKMARYAAAGGTNRVNRRLVLVAGKTFQVNSDIQFEAQIFGRDYKPLEKTSHPKITLKKVPEGVKPTDLQTTFTMEAKTDMKDWTGWFKVGGNGFRVPFVGDYELEVSADQNDPVLHKFSVKPSNPEVDETRPDFEALWELASDADTIKDRFQDPKQWEEVERALKQTRPVRTARESPDQPAEAVAASGGDVRLYFTLETAHLIPLCMKAVEEVNKARAGTDPLWPKGPNLGIWWLQVILTIVNAVLLAATLGIGVLALVRLSQGRARETAYYLVFTLILLAVLVPLQWLFSDFSPWPEIVKQPMLPLVLVGVVLLLGTEWFARKMLRLAGVSKRHPENFPAPGGLSVMATYTPPERSRQLAESHRRVRHPLSRLRNYIRLYVGLDGLLLVLFYLAVWFWVGLLLDYGLFELTRSQLFYDWFKEEPLDWVLVLPVWLRWGGLAILVGGALAVGVISLVMRALREFNEKSLALVLEKRYPDLLGDRLITAIELHDVGEATQLGYSREMVEETILEASDRVGKVPIGEVFNWNRLLLRGLIVILLGLGLYLVVGGTACAVDAASTKQASLDGFGWLNDVSGTWAERNLLVRDKPWPRKAYLEVEQFPASGDLRIAKKGGSPPQVRVKAWKWVVPSDGPERWRQMRWNDLKAYLGDGVPEAPDYLKQTDPNPTIDSAELVLGKLDRLEQVKDVIDHKLDLFVQAARPQTGPPPKLAAFLTGDVAGAVAAPDTLSAALFAVDLQQHRPPAGSAANLPRVIYYPHGNVRGELPSRWVVVDEKTQKGRPLTWADLRDIGLKLPQKVTVPDLPPGWSNQVDDVQDQVSRLNLDQMRPLQSGVLDPLESLVASGQVKGRLRKLTLPDKVVVISKGQTTWSETPLEKKGDNEYAGQLNNLAETVRFKVKGEDFFTDPRYVTLVPKPRLVKLTGDQYQPAYLYFRVPEGSSPGDIKDLKQLVANREVSLQSGDTARVEVPAGTDLVLHAQTDKPLLRYMLTDDTFKVLEGAHLDEGLLKKLQALKDRGFSTPEKFSEELNKLLTPSELADAAVPVMRYAQVSGVKIAPAGKGQAEVVADVVQTGENGFRARFTNVQRTLDFNFELTDADDVVGVQHVLINATSDRPPLVDVKVYQRPEDQVEVLRRPADGPYLVSAKAYLPFVVRGKGLSDDHGLESVDFVYTLTPLSPGMTGDSRFLQVLATAFDGGGLDTRLADAARVTEIVQEAKAAARDNRNTLRMPVAAFKKRKDDRAPLERWPLDRLTEALKLDPAAWKGPGTHPALLPDGMLREHTFNPLANPDEVADNDFFDLKPLRLPGWDGSTGGGWTKLELNVEAVDTDLLGGPHRTLSKETFPFLVVSENELLAKVIEEEEEKYAPLQDTITALEKAKEQLEKIRTEKVTGSGLPADQVRILGTAEAELQGIEGTVHTAELDMRKISRDFQRILAELKFNRVDPETIASVKATRADPMLEAFEENKEDKKWTFPMLRAHLHVMREGLDKDGLRAAEADAKRLDQLTQNVRAGSADAEKRLELLIARLKAIQSALKGVPNISQAIVQGLKLLEGVRTQVVRMQELQAKAEEEIFKGLFKDEPKPPKNP